MKQVNYRELSNRNWSLIKLVFNCFFSSGEKSKTLLRLKTALSTSEDKPAVQRLLADLSKNLERFEEELGSRGRVTKEEDRWMIEGMYSALDINLGVFLHFIRCIGLSNQLLSEKPALKGLWESFMQRPQSLEVCQAGMVKETSANAEVTGSLRNISSDDGGSQEEEVVQEEENSIQTKERKKLKRKKQHEERSWYSLW